MLDRWITKTALILTGTLCLGGDLTLAQTNAETNAGIQFNFSTPGAKSLGLGGAFLALADDATAAYTNPAGLTQLSLPEFSIEARNWNYMHVFTDGGRFRGEPTGRGVDTIKGIKNGEAENDVTGLSFLSFVYPSKRWPRWAMAFYRHEVANFEAKFKAQGAFVTGLSRLSPAETAMTLNVVNHGISTAYSLGEKEKISLGFGLSYYNFSIDSITTRFSLAGDQFGFPEFSSSNERSSQVQRGEDSDTGINIGFLWKVTAVSTLGGVYRQGPEFGFDASNEPRPGGRGFLLTSERARFKVPNVYGLGVAFKPTDSLRIIFDYDHVEYSQLTESVSDIFNTEASGNDPELERFKAEDADELHFGLEYFLLKTKTPIAIRAGTWYDPDHKIRFEGESKAFRALFLPGGDEFHYSVGLGVSGNGFQIDAAFDYSNLVKTASLSAVFYFGSRR